jgi:error-prone DNA polymerase
LTAPEPAKLNSGHPTPSPLRLGFRLIRGLRQAHAETIVREREARGPFRSFDDFARRTRLSSAVLTRLSKADAFGSLGLDRRQAQWQSLPEQRVLPLLEGMNRESHQYADSTSVTEDGRWRMKDGDEPTEVADHGSRITLSQSDGSLADPKHKAQSTKHPLPPPSSILHPHSPTPAPLPNDDEPPVHLPPMPPLDQVAADYRAAGLSLREHPLSFFRVQLKRRGVVRAADLARWPNERKVRVAGLVLLRQRPGTASGITFVTLEDETGFANLIVRPDVWERFHHAARTAKALLVRGLLQRQHGVMHVLADHLEDLSPLLARVRSESRDFR